MLVELLLALLGFRVGEIALVLVDLGVRTVELDGFKEVLHLLVLFCVDGVVQLIDEEVVVLLLFFLFLLEDLEILLSFFKALLRYEVEGSWHLL